MRTLLLLAALPLLFGCVTDADYGYVERSSTGLLLGRLTVIRDGDYPEKYFSRCVRLHAQRYSVPQDKGLTLYDKGRTLHIQGNTRWRFAFVDRYMTFQLTAQHYHRRIYTFEQIKSGVLEQKERGAIWPLAAVGIEGKRVLQALVDVVDAIEQCQQGLDG